MTSQPDDPTSGQLDNPTLEQANQTDPRNAQDIAGPKSTRKTSTNERRAKKGRVTMQASQRKGEAMEAEAVASNGAVARKKARGKERVWLSLRVDG